MNGEHDQAEEERLRWVQACCIDGSQPLPEFDGLAELAARILSTRISIVTIVTKDEHVFVANHGGMLRRVPRRGLCGFVTKGEQTQRVVLDTLEEPQCRDSIWVVNSPFVRFCASVPLVVNNVRVGTLLVCDDAPRTAFSESDGRMLTHLGAIASAMLSRRCATRSGLIAEDLINATTVASVAADPAGTITLWNDSAELLFGWTRQEAIGSNVDMIIPERFRVAHNLGMNHVSDGSRLVGSPTDLIGLRRDGSEFPIELSLTSWRGSRGVEFGAHMRDISHRKAEEAELRQQARHDPLTGLHNLRAFKEQVQEAIRADGKAAVLFIDVDDLKAVNDTFGHAMGDALLQSFALRITTALPVGASAARVGGDEFAVLIPDEDGLRQAHTVANLILEDRQMTESVELTDLTPGCSIGIAVAGLHAATTGDLVARADLAMLAAKQQGGRRVRTFDTAMLNHMKAKQDLDDELLLATKQAEWELHYQPQCDLESGNISGVEALLRWRHPVRGLIMPVAFMDQLEQHLTSLDVGRWVLNEACRQLRSWRDQGLCVPRISVNLFDRQFRHPSLALDVSAAIEQYTLRPDDLEIEITERIAIDPSDSAMDVLRTLREAGVHIAFDDFGTGYASLTTIKQLPLSRLKIDKTFVRDMHEDRGSAAIVDGIVSISRTMQIDVVAEGIENWQQVERLREAGCPHGQGFLFGKAMSPALLASLMRNPNTSLIPQSVSSPLLNGATS